MCSPGLSPPSKWIIFTRKPYIIDNEKNKIFFFLTSKQMRGNIHFPVFNQWTKIGDGENGHMMRLLVKVEELKVQMATKWQEMAELFQVISMMRTMTCDYQAYCQPVTLTCIIASSNFMASQEHDNPWAYILAREDSSFDFSVTLVSLKQENVDVNYFQSDI